MPLPPRFSYPEDARLNSNWRANTLTRTFGVAPVGLWPSEGSVSDQVFEIASEVGFKWAATDNGVLDRLWAARPASKACTAPGAGQRDGRSIGVIFRDHMLSDLVGFVYSGMEPADAANDLLRRIRDNCTAF